MLNRKRYKVVPVRFVQACSAAMSATSIGGCSSTVRGQVPAQPLWMDERGTSGDLTAITIRCECGNSRDLPWRRSFTMCRWAFARATAVARAHARERCGGTGASATEPLLVRSASNAYFAQTLSVISIPELGPRSGGSGRGVGEFLQVLRVEGRCGRERQETEGERRARRAFRTPTCGRRFSAGRAGRRRKAGIREAELETLLSAEPEVGDDRPGGISSPVDAGPKTKPRIASRIERVVKVHRLREVIAQVGFTRFEAAVSDVNGELELDVERALLRGSRVAPRRREPRRGHLHRVQAGSR